VLDGVATNVACHANYLLVLTQHKSLHLWDITAQKSLLRTSISPLLADTTTHVKSVDDIGVTDKGVPVVTLSNGESYVWDSMMDCFVCIADAHSSASPFVTSASHLYGYGKTSDEDPLNLGYLRTKAARSFEKSRLQRTPRGTSAIEELEIGMSAAAALHDTREYTRFFRAYTQQLVQTENEQRLREWCEWLLGPIRSTQDEQVAGISKRKVLQDVISLVKSGSATALQRIVAEFEEALQEINSRKNKT
jgi:protein HIRA/HIR1